MFCGKNKFILIVAFVVTILFIPPVLAKYYQLVGTGVVYETEDFYFESDLLKSDTEINSYTYQKGINSIKVTISNNIDSLRYTEIPIQYVVSIKSLSGEIVKDTDGKVIDDVTGSFNGSGIDSRTVEFSKLSAGAYKITATSTSPYQKILQAIFYLTDVEEDITYQLSDSASSPILYLTVLTADYSGNIRITFPEQIIPDSTDVHFQNVDINGTFNVVIPFKANSEYTFPFFKKDPSIVYDKSDFLVERGS